MTTSIIYYYRFLNYKLKEKNQSKRKNTQKRHLGFSLSLGLYSKLFFFHAADIKPFLTKLFNLSMKVLKVKLAVIMVGPHVRNDINLGI